MTKYRPRETPRSHPNRMKQRARDRVCIGKIREYPVRAPYSRREPFDPNSDDQRELIPS